MKAFHAFTVMAVLLVAGPVSAHPFGDGTSAGVVAGAASQEEKKKHPTVSTQDLDEQPAPVKTASPVYPASALKDTLEGVVYLNVTIGEKGAVKDVKVEKGVREDLNNAAVAAVKQWVFKPPMRKGKPVEVIVVVPVRFKLSADKK